MLILMIVLIAGLVASQQTVDEVPRTFVRTGRYNPELFGGSGWYMPDTRGKYEHMAVPYDGGYGDRGEKYIPDNFSQEWDPDRYGQDFQFRSDGFRIVQFQWNKDGKTRYGYLYETENKRLADEFGKLAMLADNSPAIRVDGSYQYEGDDGIVYEVDYVANENENFPKGKHIHESIKNVLDFILQNSTKIK